MSKKLTKRPAAKKAPAKVRSVQPGVAGLIEAAKNGYFDQVRQHIADGVDVNGIDYIHWGAIDRAAVEGWKQTVLLLLEAGADPNGQSPDHTPLMSAARNDDWVDVIRRMIAAGADVNRMNDEGKTALDVAEEYENARCVRALRRAKAKRGAILEPRKFVVVNVMEEEEETIKPLDFSRRSRPKTFDVLVKKVGAALRERANLSRVRGAVCFDSGLKAAANLIEREQVRALKQGVYLVRLEGWARGFARSEKTVVAVLPTTDWADLIALVGTNAVNYELKTADVIAALKRIEKKDPFVLTAVADDVVQGTFRSKPQNPLQLARALAAVAPDVVSQGTQTIERLAKEIASSRELFLWWD